MLAWTKNIHRRKLISNTYSGKCPNRFGFTASTKQSVFWTMVENSTKSLTCKIDSFYPYWRVISFLNGCLIVKNNYTKIKPMRLLWQFFQHRVLGSFVTAVSSSRAEGVKFV